jgi:hypothetical protein
MYSSYIKYSNQDGRVNKAPFSKLFEVVPSIPRVCGCDPMDSELYRPDQEKELTRLKTLNTFDKWFMPSMEQILAKTDTLGYHLRFGRGNVEQLETFQMAVLSIGSPENNELYWIMLGLLT